MEKNVQTILNRIDEMNVDKKTIAEVHKTSTKKYPYSIILNFNCGNVYNHTQGHTILGGLDKGTADKIATLINEHIQK